MAFRAGPLIRAPHYSHVDNVRPLFPVEPIGVHHESRFPAPDMFDQDAPGELDPDGCVLLTKIEAQSIAGLLRHLGQRGPSPRACADAIEILTLASGQAS